jgi:hypothetical protein
MSLVADSSIFDDVKSIDTMLVAGTPDYAVAYSSGEFHARLRRRAPKTRRYARYAQVHSFSVRRASSTE